MFMLDAGPLSVELAVVGPVCGGLPCKPLFVLPGWLFAAEFDGSW